MYRQRVFVLRALNQKHHQESYDRGAGVDYELPGVGETKDWSGDTPNHDDRERQQKGGGGAGSSRGLIGKPLEHISSLLFSHRTPSCNLDLNPLVLLNR